MAGVASAPCFLQISSHALAVVTSVTPTLNEPRRTPSMSKRDGHRLGNSWSLLPHCAHGGPGSSSDAAHSGSPLHARSWTFPCARKRAAQARVRPNRCVRISDNPTPRRPPGRLLRRHGSRRCGTCSPLSAVLLRPASNDPMFRGKGVALPEAGCRAPSPRLISRSTRSGGPGGAAHLQQHLQPFRRSRSP